MAKCLRSLLDKDPVEPNELAREHLTITLAKRRGLPQMVAA